MPKSKYVCDYSKPIEPKRFRTPKLRKLRKLNKAIRKAKTLNYINELRGKKDSLYTY